MDLELLKAYLPIYDAQKKKPKPMYIYMYIYT